MSLPPELRVLCLRLSTSEVSDLPRLTPTLLSHVIRCQSILSSPAESTGKSDASASSVQVHKLKTQLTTLLNGRSPEGRFTAVVLIKAVVEVGGWEVLRGCLPWVTGLLSVLGKPDSSATKELCIIALTKIYCMTHPYQTLLREITTPTLPTFVTACLNLISSKSSTKTLNVSSSLPETIFQSFAMLIPRHTSIFRPFAFQIRAASRQYLAPTSSDDLFVPPTVKQSARRLVVVLHQTVAKGGGGAEWKESVGEVIKTAHITADNVFRAVVEDWESTAGYVAGHVDINQDPSGGGGSAEDLPRWTGVSAGAERLTGLLELLSEYVRGETSTPVTVPLGSFQDLITRLLSIGIPLSSDSSSARGGARLNPAIDRDERDILWSVTPQVYVAALRFAIVLCERLQEGFMCSGQGLLDQLIWVFPFGKHDSDFRLVTYSLLSSILLQIGRDIGKNSTKKLDVVIKSCCNDLPDLMSLRAGEVTETVTESRSTSNQNADSFLRNTSSVAVEASIRNADLEDAAAELLPLLVSHLPQQYLHINTRALIERTAVLTRNKDAMLATVLYPFFVKQKALASMVPHIAREFGDDGTVEILLRPRMPLLPTTSSRVVDDTADSESEDEDMDVNTETISAHQYPFASNGASHQDVPLDSVAPTSQQGLGSVIAPQPAATTLDTPAALQNPAFPINTGFLATAASQVEAQSSTIRQDIVMDEEGSENSDDDDESVHLNMDLDTDEEEN